MKKTKIVCTMGPNTNDREMMRKLIQNGMNVARFNFSHGDHEEQKGRMDMLKELREEEHATTAILLDTKGPEIRTGVLKDGKKIKLETGKTFTLTTEDIVGDENKVSITYKGLAEDVSEGKIILIDDGLIGLKVIGKTDKEIHCEIINGGELGEKKGVNVPGVPVRLPAITEKDKEDIKFGAEQGIDFIAASFVRNAECILEIKAYLKSLGAPYIPIIAKIENEEGISNIDEIIRAADETCEDMVPDNRLFSKREALLQQVTEQNSFDSAVELVRNHIGEIFQTLSDANSSSGQRQARLALDYIQKNYMDPDLSLNSICSYLNISTSYFSTIFKELTGETFTEVLIRTRMEKAKELLENTTMKNYEIAEKVGFADPHYFGISFKKMTGCTPTEYAREKRK